MYSFSRYSYYFKSQHYIRLKQFEEKNLQIEHLLIQQGEILGFVAHDLRTPLNNIEALSHLLYDDKPGEELRMIMNSTDQAKNIINDLIEAIKTEKTALDTTTLNLTTFLSSTVDKWKTNSKRNFTLIMAESEISAQANASKMERVLDNLISNAIKFSSDEKGIIISLNKVAKKIIIKVKDEGIGIPSHLIPFVFQQFSQAGRIGLRGEKSLGLGMHISKKIMHQHGGELMVESEENKGTQFTVLLPIRQ
ncbi:Sensor histidine kinase ResE [compost metagenome]